MDRTSPWSILGRPARSRTFRQVPGSRSWIECEADGTKRFSFEETARDAWSVYLRDPSRSLDVQLDLYTKEVKFSYGASVGVLARVVNAEATFLSSIEVASPSSVRMTVVLEDPSAPAATSTKKVITVIVPDMLEIDKLAVMNWIKVQATGAKLPFCWRETYARGVGEPPSSCRNGLERGGLLCYPKCEDGYDGDGPVCWARCPPGYVNMGPTCQKPAPYGRTGYPWQLGDKLGSLDGARARCLREHRQGCEDDGVFVYPKCKPGFHAVG